MAWISTTERTEDQRRAIAADFEARGSQISLSRIDTGWWAYMPKTVRPWQSHVRLNNTPMSREDWKRIELMKCRIVGLKLNGAEFDDSDLLAIGTLPSFQRLQDVGFYETNVTDEGVLRFQRYFPHCIVHSHKARLTAQTK
jgi:hypothetical protein